MRNDKGMSVVDFLLIVFLLVAIGGAAWYWQEIKIEDLTHKIAQLERVVENTDEGSDGAEGPNYIFTSEKGVEVEVFKPVRNAEVSGQVRIIGQVPGNWSFEADFPVEIRDRDGNVIAQGIAQLQGDWMTEELVLFTAEIGIDGEPEGEGAVVLQRSNPSGEEENDDQVRVPVRF